MWRLLLPFNIIFGNVHSLPHISQNLFPHRNHLTISKTYQSTKKVMKSIYDLRKSTAKDDPTYSHTFFPPKFSKMTSFIRINNKFFVGGEYIFNYPSHLVSLLSWFHSIGFPQYGPQVKLTIFYDFYMYVYL